MEWILMTILSDTLALAALPGQVILTCYKVKENNVVLNFENPVKILQGHLKLWMKVFKMFFHVNSFDTLEMVIEGNTFQLEKINDSLHITKNGLYLHLTRDVFLKLIVELPKMYISCLCLPGEICLILSCILEKYERQCLDHFKQTLNFDFDLCHEIEMNMLELIKTMSDNFHLKTSPFFVYTVLSQYKADFKYLLQCKTFPEYVNSEQLKINVTE